MPIVYCERSAFSLFQGCRRAGSRPDWDEPRVVRGRVDGRAFLFPNQKGEMGVRPTGVIGLVVSVWSEEEIFYAALFVCSA